MPSATGAQKARCVHCREDVTVPDHYAHGDHVKCGACGTKHKVEIHGSGPSHYWTVDLKPGEKREIRANFLSGY